LTGNGPGLLQRIAALFSGAGSAPREPAERASEASPTTPLTAEDERLPNASRPRVAKLLAMIADIEARVEADPLLASAMIEVRQMRDVHLPRLLASYADIPPAHRAEIFRATGRSASYEFNAAVDRMLERAAALSRSLAQQDINDFAANLRFIERRYGSDDPIP
jgi:hypothetical protein